MGRGLAAAALELGHEVVVVSGPVEVDYPAGAEVIPIISTEELLEVSTRVFADCDGLIGAAAPCDYRPEKVEDHKISKTGHPITLHLIETPDVVATLGAGKRPDQWTVGFALETDDPRFRALVKLEKKHCDLIVLNGPAAMNAEVNDVEVLDPQGKTAATFSGPKDEVAGGILSVIQTRLVERTV